MNTDLWQVLTGATGSLGAHILSRLTASSSVRKVVCLSRARSHQDSLERLKKSVVLRKVQIDEEKIVSYSSTVQAPFLGLTEEQYNELKSEVTDVIHVRLCYIPLSQVYLPCCRMPGLSTSS